MVRQLFKNDVPELWRKRGRAGLCPVCGKTKAEFDKGMIVYCSKKCRDEYVSHYEIWGNLRDKILKRDKETCKKCGINEEKAKIRWEKSKGRIFKEFFIKEAKEIEVFRNKELELLSKRYEEEYNEIMDDLKLFRRIDWDLRKQFEKDYPEIFSHFPKIPSFNVDHIKAVVNDGDMWDEKNLQVLCEECHKKKTKEDMLERKRKRIKTKPITSLN